ncbi:MAG: nodulation protein NfeD, partial [Pirellulales bacterium]|nr:nodulation protein NfeD [Pirellulales bacterium]
MTKEYQSMESIVFHRSVPTLLRWMPFCVAVATIVPPAIVAIAQEAADGQVAKTGYLIEVPVPLESRSSRQLIDQLSRLAESAPADQRITVVLRYPADIETGAGKGTAFEDGLRLARAIAAPELRSVRVVSLVEGEVGGHSTLPIAASDLLIMSGGGAIANASAGEPSVDETVVLNYQSICARRGLFPPAVVAALVDPGLELARVSKVGGGQVFASGQELKDLRESGEVLGEEIWSAAGIPLKLDARQLRTARIAAGMVDSLDQAAELLDLAELNPIDQKMVAGEATGVFLDISGAIVRNRSRRWQSNLNGTLESGEVNTWVVAIDSGGGSLGESASLAGWFAEPEPPLRAVAGWIRGEARGDAALVAVACKPLFISPDARLGGPGSEAISGEKLSKYDELIEQIAR